MPVSLPTAAPQPRPSAPRPGEGKEETEGGEGGEGEEGGEGGECLVAVLRSEDCAQAVTD